MKPSTLEEGFPAPVTLFRDDFPLLGVETMEAASFAPREANEYVAFRESPEHPYLWLFSEALVFNDVMSAHRERLEMLPLDHEYAGYDGHHVGMNLVPAAKGQTEFFIHRIADFATDIEAADNPVTARRRVHLAQAASLYKIPYLITD